MKNQLRSLFNNVEGDWISCQTIYSLKTKQIKCNEHKKHITLLRQFKNISKLDTHSYNGYTCEYTKGSNKKIIYQYINTGNKFMNRGIIQKIDGNSNQEYEFTFNNNYYLKVKCTKKEIDYIEYIYSINKNFRISIVMIKRAYKYIAICFNSDIKINK